jgi:hypothetical protein
VSLVQEVDIFCLTSGFRKSEYRDIDHVRVNDIFDVLSLALGFIHSLFSIGQAAADVIRHP